jgi:hypothetical protein
LNGLILFDPISLLYQTKMYALMHQKISLRMVIESLFAIPENWKQPRLAMVWYLRAK